MLKIWNSVGTKLTSGMYSSEKSCDFLFTFIMAAETNLVLKREQVGKDMPIPCVDHKTDWCIHEGFKCWDDIFDSIVRPSAWILASSQAKGDDPQCFSIWKRCIMTLWFVPSPWLAKMVLLEGSLAHPHRDRIVNE